MKAKTSLWVLLAFNIIFNLAMIFGSMYLTKRAVNR